MKVSAPIPEADATALVIPGEWNPTAQTYIPGGAWQWADPILAGASNAAEWKTFPYWDPRYGHADNRTVQNVITQLYACGYALVKVLPEDGAT